MCPSHGPRRVPGRHLHWHLLRRLARDPAVMGENALGGVGRLLTGAVFTLVAVSVAALAALSVF